MEYWQVILVLFWNTRNTGINTGNTSNTENHCIQYIRKCILCTYASMRLLFSFFFPPYLSSPSLLSSSFLPSLLSSSFPPSFPASFPLLSFSFPPSLPPFRRMIFNKLRNMLTQRSPWTTTIHMVSDDGQCWMTGMWGLMWFFLCLLGVVLLFSYIETLYQKYCIPETRTSLKQGHP